MKWIQILACLGLMIGCAHEQPQGSKQSNMNKRSDDLNVDVAIEKALENKDYRLLLTQGRRPVSPGLEHIPIEELKDRCGTKFLTGMGDVIKSTAEKKARVAKYNFAKAYNLKMYAICQKATDKHNKV
ncbi:hypothetical protein [Pseudoalteromonas luteoviolacea]|uniref:hypothetical protein n=1 Tax=Pseudoalteromonas luteoviolacea TaxID=43657 RepID=UPI00114E0EA2|nr:hypothetical protein [Pseudoalteromonas luteoviolacea]TQF67916.1 hypothetical protein FLM44_22320 [Pseudoalteromonas luteoviolacea]